MDDSTAAMILVLASRPELACRWADMLRDTGTQFCFSAADLSPGQQPDLVVSDVPPDDRGDAGVVQIGAAAWAGPPPDVRLPADVSARELQTASRLLLQIVRLRRHDRSRAELQRRLLEAAMTDPVSGLPNRRAWDRALAQRMGAANAAQRLCLAIFDLDHFKQINSAYGHAVGDDVLRAAGQAIRNGLRHNDFVARLGGDEFGLLLWVADEAVTAAVIERVRAELPLRLSDHGTQAVTASAGYCLSEERGAVELPPSAGSLFAAADAAMREAKKQGRNRTVGGRR